MPASPRNSAGEAGADSVLIPTVEHIAARRVAECEVQSIEAVAVETPLALIYNKIDHAVMMVTPRDLEDFVMGFSISEGILRRPQELDSIEIQQTPSGIEARIVIAHRREMMLNIRRRNLIGRSGCGICGVDSLKAALPPLRRLLVTQTPSFEAIHTALSSLPQAQQLNSQTHAVHGAAWVNMSGEIQLLREDVGRHNALDKLIGAMTRNKIEPHTGFAVITSRCSVEMVQKAVTARIATLVAISAPTSLAIEVAKEAGLRVIALARSDSVIVYAEGTR
jgi:formate dehydrogenase accessory protein FdhD